MNKGLFKHTIAFLTTVCYQSVFWAQDTVIKRDSSNVGVTYFKDNLKERYTGDDFNYSINDTGGINLMQRILRKFFNWMSDLFGFDIDFIDYKTLEYIVYGFWFRNFSNHHKNNYGTNNKERNFRTFIHFAMFLIVH